MKTISKFLLFTLVLLLVGLGAVSAAENTSENTQDTDIAINNDITANVLTDTSSKIVQDTSSDSIIESSTQNKTIKKNNELKNNTNTKTARTTTLTNNTYNQFFNTTSTTSLIGTGDTINLKGTFNNVNFTLDKQITLTSSDKSAKLINCSVVVLASGSGSTISNLVINNSIEYTSGIQIKDSNNLIIENNTVEVCGLHSYALAANVNQSTIRYNSFETHKFDPDTERTHSAVVLSCSYYNTFANNTVKSDGANCIYLSSYQAVGINGGPSYYNNITGNTVYGAPVGWSYTIQIFGTNNIVSYNTVSGGYRGLSSENPNNIFSYNDVDAINVGIFASDDAQVLNNNIHVSDMATAITIGGTNVKVINNTIQAQEGRAIEIQASNANISENEISSEESYGIHSKGAYTNINIIHNNINSKREGILFEKQSNTKKVNNILVDRNTVNSEADYAINFLDAGAARAADINVTVTGSNVLSSSNGKGLNLAYLKPSNSVENSSVDTNQVITVTPGNYTHWFTDETSNLNIEQNATVYLSGTFNNINFIFDKKVNIIGTNSVINNGTITLTGDAHESTIKNVTINNNKNDYTVHGIELLEVNNCKITNVKINNYGISESLGIFIYGADGNTVSDSTITTSGDYLNNGILAYASDSNTFKNNKVNINQSNVPREYDTSVMFNDKIGIIQEVLHNHGIILLYSSNNIINKNNINVTSMFDSYTAPSQDCQNSIVGIDIYFDSHSNKVTENTIKINSYAPFVYGMGVLGASWGTSITSSNATNNVYENNNVTLTGGYFATGFIAGKNSVNTQIKSNNFKINVNKDTANHGDYAHGITLENSTKSTITGNTITTNGSSLYNMELFDSSDNTITYNKFTGTGTHPYGIAAYRSSNNNIQNNTMTLRKVNNGATSQAQHTDAIPYGDEGIMLMSTSTNNIITGNSINTNATYSVKLTDETSNNKVTENALVAKTKYGDNSVNDQASNTVSNNFIYFVNVTATPVNAELGDTVTFTANIDSTTTNLSNLTATFTLGTNNIGTSKISNGKATLSYQISTLWRATTYQITVQVSGTNFQNATGIAQATFTKGAEPTTTTVAKVLQTIGSNATLTANITSESGGKIGAGQAEFYLDGNKLSTVDVKLGTVSYVYPISSTSTSGEHTIKVVYLGTTDYKSSEGTNTLGIQTKTSITLTNHTAKLGETTTIKATIKSGNTNVAKGNAKIYIGTQNIGTATISNGAINYNYTVPSTFNKGTYDLKVVFDGNNTLKAATKTAKITINPYTPVFGYNTTKVNVGSTASLVLAIDNGATGNKQYKADSGNVTIKLNGQALTDNNGQNISGAVKNGTIKFTFTAPKQLVGYQNLTFTYEGNTKFASLTKKYTNALLIENSTSKTTKITINKIGSVKYNNNATITGKLTDESGNIIANTDLTITVNNAKTSLRTDGNGIFTHYAKATTLGTNNVTVSFGGNSDYKASTAKTTYSVVKQDLVITINKISTVKYNANVTITGKFTDATGKLLGGTTLKLNLNGKTVSVKTDSKSTFTYTTKVTSVGTNNVSVSYQGNTKYNAKTSKATFNVTKQNLVITLNSIKQVGYGETTTIKGTFSDATGKLLGNSVVKVKINTKTVNVKANAKGVFTYNVKTSVVGTNNVTVSYPGNVRYNAKSVKTTFNVVKQNLSIKINSIKSVKYGEQTVISGTFSDATGKVLPNSALKVKVNTKTYSVKTNKSGVYTLTIKTNKAGTNNVTVSHNGNTKYNKASTKSTFQVGKQNLNITINSITSVAYGDKVSIKGTFSDATGKLLSNSVVKINLNGKTYTAKTNSKGVYSTSIQTTSMGTNNVTVSYAGNSNYNAFSTKATFTVTKQNVIVSITKITTASKTATITGTFTDKNGKKLVNSNVKLTVNGKAFTAKTDSNGEYTLTTSSTIVGTNTVTASYAGNSKYNAYTSAQKTFTIA